MSTGKLLVLVLLAMLMWLPACLKSSRDSQPATTTAAAGGAGDAGGAGGAAPGHRTTVTDPFPDGKKDVPTLSPDTLEPEVPVPDPEPPGNTLGTGSRGCFDEERFRAVLVSENVETGSDDALAQRSALEDAMHPLVMELVGCMDAISQQLHRLVAENELSTHGGEQDIAAGQVEAMRRYERLMEIRSGQGER